MPFRHVLIAVLTVAIWGTNFMFIKIALQDFPPFTLAALRFFFTAIPAVFFLPRPKVNWQALVGYGFSIFTIQFGFLFLGMRLGMSAGLASMILQVQVFITIGLSAFLLKERPGFLKILGALIAFAGVAMVGLHSSQDVNPLGLLMLLIGALGWAIGNIIAKSLSSTNVLALVAWGGLVATPPLVLVAALLEKDEALVGFQQLHLSTVLAMLYIVYISTHVGFSLWSWLLRQHSASTVAPFTLLVPVFGFLGSVIVLKETLPDWKIHAGILVVAGLAVNLYASKVSAPFRT